MGGRKIGRMEGRNEGKKEENRQKKECSLERENWEEIDGAEE